MNSTNRTIRPSRIQKPMCLSSMSRRSQVAPERERILGARRPRINGLNRRSALHNLEERLLEKVETLAHDRIRRGERHEEADDIAAHAAGEDQESPPGPGLHQRLRESRIGFGRIPVL